jgi:hypothetical protein
MMLNPILRHHLSSYLSRTVLTNVLHTVFLSKDLRPTAGKKFYVVKLVLAAVASFAGLSWVILVSRTSDRRIGTTDLEYLSWDMSSV